MTRHEPRRRVLAGAGATIAAGLAGCLSTAREIEETSTQTIDAEGLDALSITGNAGPVTVRGAERETIELRTTKEVAGENDLDTIEVHTERRGDTFSIEVERQDVLVRLGPEPRLSIELAVPRDLQLPSIEMVTGMIDIRDVRGPVDLDTENAAIIVDGVDGDVTAETTNGVIDVRNVAGTVSASATNGAIEVEDADRIDTLETTNGAIDATASSVTDGASITARNGSVDLRLERPLDATVSADVGNGELTYIGDPTPETQTSGSLELVLGDGSNALDVQTVNGDATIRVIDT